MDRGVNGSRSGERRRAARRAGTSLAVVGSVLIRPGRRALVVDYSPWGALVETEGCMAPGGEVTMQVETAERRFVIGCHVVRSTVSGIRPGVRLRCRSGLSFKEFTGFGQSTDRKEAP